MLKFVVLVALLTFDKTILGALQPPLKSLGCGESLSDGVGWTISKTDDPTFKCDGSLIHPSIILTSASCILGIPLAKMEVRGMKWNPVTNTKSLSNERRTVSKIVNHDNFNVKLGTNDLSIVVLTEPVVLDDFVNTVCLPSPEAVFDESRCFVSNVTEDIFAQKHHHRKILEHNELTVISPTTCLNIMSKKEGKRGTVSLISNRNLLCADRGITTEGQDGGAGSPLICPVEGERGRYVQAGIVSSSLSYHKKRIPGLYCNVAHMREWIDIVMENFKFSNSYYTYRPRIHDPSKKVYVITPTYKKPDQLALLTKLAETLMLVENMHWLVVEDAEIASPRVTKLLKHTGLNFEHLIAPMPDEYKKDPSKVHMYKHMANINCALEWLRKNATEGVFYYALEDRIHASELFDEIRQTRKVSMFPVGSPKSGWGVSSPILRNGTFEGYFDAWRMTRKYQLDLSGFAVNVAFFLQRPNAKMPTDGTEREDGFIRSLEPLEMDEVDFLGEECTRVFVWQTEGVRQVVDVNKYLGTNIEVLAKQF